MVVLRGSVSVCTRIGFGGSRWLMHGLYGGLAVGRSYLLVAGAIREIDLGG